MQIPPVIRLGRPPQPVDLRTGFVVLTRKGWHIVKWHVERVLLIDQDVACSAATYIHPSDVFCWMPEDGS